MKIVHILYVILEYIFMLAFAAALVAGVFNWHWFIWAGVALLCYFVWGVIMLRCPWCGAALEPSRLILGPWRRCYCPDCGHEITVALWISRKGAAQLRIRARESRGKDGGTPDNINSKNNINEGSTKK